VSTTPELKTQGFSCRFFIKTKINKSLTPPGDVPIIPPLKASAGNFEDTKK
jgi:hypothetical protein